MNVKLNSPEGTEKKDRMFVIETPSVSVEKVSYLSVETDLNAAEREIKGLKEKVVRLKEIKSQMDNIA